MHHAKYRKVHGEKQRERSFGNQPKLFLFISILIYKLMQFFSAISLQASNKVSFFIFFTRPLFPFLFFCLELTTSLLQVYRIHIQYKDAKNLMGWRLHK